MSKHLLTLKELNKDEILALIGKAIEIKANPAKYSEALKGKTVALIFSKPSTRTRVSFEAAVTKMGGSSIYLSSSDMQLSRGEAIEDTAKVLSKYVDAVVIRTFKQKDVDDFAKASEIPVINGLTDEYHPCQILADLMTIYETKGYLKGITLTYLGDGNNVANTLVIGAAINEMNVVLSSPKGYEVSNSFIADIKQKINTKAKIDKTANPAEAVKNADFIYTDVWVSMGQEEKSKDDFKSYQINANLLEKAPDKVMVMHCLPAHRDEEITSDVIDGPESIIWQQAENRLHLQKALLLEKIK